MAHRPKGPRPAKRDVEHSSNSHSALLNQQKEIGLILYALCLANGGEMTVSKAQMWSARKWRDHGNIMNVYFRKNDDESVTITTKEPEDEAAEDKG